MTITERKYLIATVLGVVAIVGWNVFLVQRDDKLYKAYYHEKAKAERLASMNQHQKFCASQSGWHPDCNME